MYVAIITYLRVRLAQKMKLCLKGFSVSVNEK